MAVKEPAKKLIYEPGEHRDKHCWNQPRAAIVQQGSTAIGKCPNTLDKAQAGRLLEDAEYEGKVQGQSVADFLPPRMWNVHQGIVYEAVPTQAGSYHGYPWCGRPGRNRLPRSVRAALKQRAEEQGFGKEFENWMYHHEK